jgi:tRNA-specific 2-thiouridylase
LQRSKIWLTDINWIGAGDFGADLDGQKVKIKVRSTRPPVPATFRLTGEDIMIELAAADEGISPGQACVFYAPDEKADRTLGGGWITRTE